MANCRKKKPKQANKKPKHTKKKKKHRKYKVQIIFKLGCLNRINKYWRLRAQYCQILQQSPSRWIQKGMTAKKWL